MEDDNNNGEENSQLIDEMAVHVKAMLELIGLDLSVSDLKDTPRRVAKMQLEIFSGLDASKEPKITVFPNEDDYHSMVVVRDIPFYSVCAHHLVPFFGIGHIAYIPSDCIVGLSKIARILEFFARRPQVQERLTQQTADYLEGKINPQGVMVVLEARHLCMEMRGVEKPGSWTVTSTMRGQFDEKIGGSSQFREEFLQHIGRANGVLR